MPDDDHAREASPSAPSARRAFSCTDGRSDMANHLTPDELSKEVGIDREEVIRICVERARPDLPRQDRQDALPGTAHRDQGVPARELSAGRTEPRTEDRARLRPAAVASLTRRCSRLALVARCCFAAGLRGCRLAVVAATDARSASIRSTIGASAASGPGSRGVRPSSFGAEELPELGAVVALELRRLEAALRALDDLAGERELLGCAPPTPASDLVDLLLRP